MDLLRQREEEILPRLRGIAFTDSVHWVSPRDPAAVRKFVIAHAVNWVKSDEPLDTLVTKASSQGCKEVSAGHPKHEYTSGTSVESVFAFLNGKVTAAEAEQGPK